MKAASPIHFFNVWIFEEIPKSMLWPGQSETTLAHSDQMPPAYLYLAFITILTSDRDSTYLRLMPPYQITQLQKEKNKIKDLESDAGREWKYKSPLGMWL